MSEKSKEQPAAKPAKKLAKKAPAPASSSVENLRGSKPSNPDDRAAWKARLVEAIRKTRQQQKSR